MAAKRRSPEVFEKILVQAAKEGVFPIFDTRARAWFRKKAQETTNVTPQKIIKERKITTDTPKIGDCLIFKYDAEYKKRLPYWDEYPAIFLLEIYQKDQKYLGINLHYLPYLLRAKLMDALYSQLTITEEGYVMKLRYRILKAAARYKAFRPCVKQYRWGNIRSRFVKITPSEMDIAMFLPIARWQNDTQDNVWRDSEAKIKRYKPGPRRV